MKIRVLFVGAMALAAMPSFGSVIFDQITGGGPDAGDLAYVSDNFESALASFSSIQVDDFSTTQAFTLTNISLGLDIFPNSPPLSGITGYGVEIYNWNGGTPANSLTGNVASFNVSPGQASASAAGFWSFSNGYEVTLDLTSFNFTLGAGHYWIGVVPSYAYAANGSTETGIMGSNLAAANSVATNAYTVNPGGGFGSGPTQQTSGAGTNLAYELTGSVAAPEPASIALLGLGLVGLVARRRRASK